MQSMFTSAGAVAYRECVTATFHMSRCVHQVGMESPWAFNLVIRTILKQVEE